jgi:DNA-binding transcriptional MerR regulator
VDNAGQTVSATEFAALTGVSRERLRTWERRHGFPTPVRVDGGARRYDVRDITHVVGIRRAVEAGVPLRSALQAWDQQDADAAIGLQAEAGLAQYAPLAIVSLSGPQPLVVRSVNALVAARPDAPKPGDDVLELAPWFAEEPGYQTLRRLFTDDLMAAPCTHPDWTAGMRPGAQSLAYRLPHEVGRSPLVALIGIDTARERRTRERLQEAETEVARLRAQLALDRDYAEAADAVATIFRSRAGAATLADATTVLVRRIGAVDAGLAPTMGGALVLGRSSRGLLGPELVTVARFDDLAEALRQGDPAWMPESVAAAFGAPTGLELLVVPLQAASENLGALLMLFDDVGALSKSGLPLLRVAAGTIALALVRERVAGELQDPGL